MRRSLRYIFFCEPMSFSPIFIDMGQKINKTLREFTSAGAYPDFKDGQFNPLMKDRAYPPTMNMNTAPLSEDREELGQHSELVEKIMAQLGVKNFVFAGHGSMGDAYFIPNDRVLKITTDRTEAVESSKIKGKNLPHLANIYEVYALKGDYDGIYVIIGEKLEQTSDIQRVTDLLQKYLYNMHNSDVGSLFRNYLDGDISRASLEEMRVGIEEYYQESPQDGLDAEWLFDSKMGIVDDMKANGVRTTDFNHLPNQGLKKNGILAVFDLGFGRRDQEMPEVVKDLTLAEDEISQEELIKKDLPYQYSNLFQDFVLEKTEKEIREIAPGLDLTQNKNRLIINLEKNYPSLFDNFADWLADKV